MKTILLALLAILTGLAAAQPADTVYLNANIHTVDPDNPRAEAIAVREGRIAAVGSETVVGELIGPTTAVIDLQGMTVLPGLTDAHAHLTGLGAIQLGVIDLAGTATYEEVIALVRARAAQEPEGTWILGRGWDHESWPSKTLPNHEMLSNEVPNHPVVLGRVDGHSNLANKLAMELAGIDRDTANPSGGEVIKDADGEPTGVFIDNAMSFVNRAVPESARARTEDLIIAGQEAALAVGLTGVHDMGSSPGVVEVYKQLEADGALKLRMDLALSAAYAVRYYEENEPYVGDYLTVRAAKLYMDGAMGSRGAWLLEPYTDRPTDNDGNPYTGLAVMDPERVEFISTHALQKGYQIRAHAIGDRGNREALDAFERAAQTTGVDLASARFRVEHAQLLSPADIPRFGRLGVIASMQQTHATSDMRWMADRVGNERVLGGYAWASLARSGAIIAGGSDFPVEHHNPFLGFYASITRQNAQAMPSGGWLPSEKLTRTETLESFTINAAYAAFSEDRRGSLEAGKDADFIVIDRDIMTIEPSGILGTRVLRTVIAGETVFELGN
ncbi:MAG: amidohydrolase [Planctomycetota bacterium]